MVNLENRGLVAVRVGSGLSALALLLWTFHGVDWARVSESMLRVGALSGATTRSARSGTTCIGADSTPREPLVGKRRTGVRGEDPCRSKSRATLRRSSA